MTDPEGKPEAADQQSSKGAQLEEASRKKWVVPAVIIAALVALVALIVGVNASTGGDEAETATTFDVRSGLAGLADEIYANNTCRFYDAQIQAGDPVVLRGADGTIVGKTELTFNKSEQSFCQYDFVITDVVAGEAGYELTIGDYDPIIVTESELRSPQYWAPRNSMEAVWGYAQLTRVKPLTG